VQQKPVDRAWPVCNLNNGNNVLIDQAGHSSVAEIERRSDDRNDFRRVQAGAALAGPSP
jgi:hypothetical protein